MRENVSNIKNSTRFISTKTILKGIQTAPISFIDAVFQGLAPDGGLYYPHRYIDLSEHIKRFVSDVNMSFVEMASHITRALFPAEFSEEQAATICEKAFQFSPAFHYIDEEISLLELFHGQSCAFKDFGASYLAAVMEERLEEQDTRITILTATSGDTGSAVAQAFHNKKNIEVVLLYPSNKVSPLQEKQLTGMGDNIYALEVEGTFDDCQRLVKEAFQNEVLCKKYGLSSANSINIGRLIPQSFYYIYAWVKLQQHNENDWVFCVPSGNYGNLTAGLLARSWGLPIKHFIAASNENDSVPKYLRTGIYTPHDSFATLANAMDVGNPSNFERLETLFLLESQKQNTKNDTGTASYKTYKNTIHTYMKQCLYGESVSDVDIREEMKRVYHMSHSFVCPHTAVGVCAGRRALNSADFGKKHNYKKTVVLSTAHPAKFFEIIEDACGEKVKLPERLEHFLHKEKTSTKIYPTRESFQESLQDLLG